jgi:putative FmdB family regulatory protein
MSVRFGWRNEEQEAARHMPTYEYACSECGHHFDVRQSFHDEPLRDCPQCGASVHRVVHAAGVIFKGSGWYINDSRSGSQASHSDASKTSTPSATKSGDSTASTSSGDAKSDSSGESKSTSKSDAKATVKSAADD